MRDFFCVHVENENEAERHINHDIKIPRPKHCDIEIRGLKPHDIEKRRQLSHDIVIPRLFFRGQKATTSRFQIWKTRTSRSQDSKATISSFCGILTLVHIFQKQNKKNKKNECYTLVLMILAKSVLADSSNNISWLVQGTIT